MTNISKYGLSYNVKLPKLIMLKGKVPKYGITKLGEERGNSYKKKVRDLQIKGTRKHSEA